MATTNSTLTTDSSRGNISATYVIVGGGISGVTCAEALSTLCPDERIILVTASNLVKTVVNFQQVSRAVETFDVKEQPSSLLEANCPNVLVVRNLVSSLKSQDRQIVCEDNTTINYKKLCICTGGHPKVIPGNTSQILGIRDLESVKEFQKKLKDARRILVVGNGGIATELVHEIHGCEVVWVIKDAHITSTFIDKGAAHFFLPHLNNEKTDSTAPLKRLKYVTESSRDCLSKAGCGAALGPDWSTSHTMMGSEKTTRSVSVQTNAEIQNVYSAEEFKLSGDSKNLKSTNSDQVEWPVYVTLTSGAVYGCDFIVSATGMQPNSEVFIRGNCFDVCSEGHLKVSSDMLTSVPDVYAAGDVCKASWELAPLWFQMHLWSQARQMGFYAAKCMDASLKGESIHMDFCFELFTHSTSFFNFKVILLGKFNAQGLGQDYELLLRVTKGEEYVKAVVSHGRLVGAILIGETDLEETFENLILNGIDLTPFKDHLLDPEIDIEDFFD